MTVFPPRSTTVAPAGAVTEPERPIAAMRSPVTTMSALSRTSSPFMVIARAFFSRIDPFGRAPLRVVLFLRLLLLGHLLLQRRGAQVVEVLAIDGVGHPPDHRPAVIGPADVAAPVRAQAIDRHRPLVGRDLDRALAGLRQGGDEHLVLRDEGHPLAVG